MFVTKLQVELTEEEYKRMRSLYDDGDGCYEDIKVILLNRLASDLYDLLSPDTIEYTVL